MSGGGRYHRPGNRRYKSKTIAPLPERTREEKCADLLDDDLQAALLYLAEKKSVMGGSEDAHMLYGSLGRMKLAHIHRDSSRNLTIAPNAEPFYPETGQVSVTPFGEEVAAVLRTRLPSTAPTKATE